MLNTHEVEYNTLIVHLAHQTEVSRLGTERSSMEALILTCLQAQLIVGRIQKQDIPKQAKNELIWELKQIAPKECKIDAKAD